MKGLKIKGGILLAAIMGVLATFIVPNAFAEEAPVVFVPSGENTLEEAVESAASGSKLILENGTYKGKAVTINKDLTIVGNKERSIVDVAFIFDKKEDGSAPDITIDGYSSSMYQKPGRHLYLQVKGKVNLNLKNININQIYRGGDSDYDERDIQMQIEKEAAGSEINLDNVSLNGSFEAVRLLSANTTLNVKNQSTLSAQNAIEIAAEEQATGNKINVEDSTLEGRLSLVKDHEEVISINNQKDLTINLTNSILKGQEMPSSATKPTKLISFDENASSNVKINIKGSSQLIDQTKIEKSVLFDFGTSNSEDNQIYIEKDVTYGSDDIKTVEHKYNTNEAYAVVGIFDYAGNLTIKPYNKNEQITDDLLRVKTQDMETLGEENHKFKGWFKTQEFTEEFPEKSNVEENMDLYPNIVELVKVTIDGEEFTLEKGQSLNDLDPGKLATAKEKLAKLKQNVEDAKGTFSGYYLSDGISGEEVAEGEMLTKPINATSTIVAIHNVTVTIGEQVIKDIPVGTKLSALKGRPEYDNAFEKDGKKLKRFAITGKETDTFGFDEEILENINLTPKYGVKIIIKKDADDLEPQEYLLEENTAIEKDKEINDALTAVKNPAKRFGRFVDQDQKEITTSEEISEDKTITPIYQVEVTVKYQEETIGTFLMDENTTLSQLSGGEKDKFDGYMTQLQGKVPADEGTFDPARDDNLADSHGHVINKNTTKIYEDITIVPKVHVKITITSAAGDKEFEIFAGQKLSDATNKNDLDATKVKDKRTFSRYVVNADESTFDEDSAILKNLKLTAKYNVTLTIGGQQFPLEEGLTLDDLTGEGQTILEGFRNNVKNKSLDRFVYQHTDDLGQKDEVPLAKVQETKINDNLTITPIYHVSVSVVTDKDQETGHTFVIDEGKKLSDLEGEDATKLEELKTKEERTFSRWVSIDDEDNEETFEEESQINGDITIRPIFSVKVKIEGKDNDGYLLEEGNTLNSSGEIAAALEEVKDKTTEGKNFDHFENIESGKNDTIDPEKTQIDDNVTLKAKYTYDVDINGTTFKVPEGKTLNDLEDPNVDTKLEELKTQTKTDGYNFLGYVDENGDDFTKEKTTINKKTTVKAKYNVKITIKGADGKQHDFEINSNENLKDIPDVSEGTNEDYNNVTTKDERQFAKKFYNEADRNEIITEDTPIEKNMTLIAIFNVTVTIKDKPYYIEEGKSLNTNQDALNALKAFESDEKKLSGYVYGGKTPIDEDDPINDNITITPVYTVTLTIKYGDDVIGKFENLPENKSINDLEDQKTQIEAALDTLKTRVTNDKYNFTGYVANGEDFTTSTNITKDTTVTAKYNIKVTIAGLEGDKDFTVESGSTIADVKNSNEEDYKTAIKKDNRKLLHFIADDEDHTIIKEDDKKYTFTKNTVLTPVFAVEVTIGEETYKLEEGKTLNSSEEIKQALEDIKDKSGNKTFDHFENTKDGKSEEINPDETAINDNMTITPIYKIAIKINNYKGDLLDTIYLKEGEALENAKGAEATKLNDLKTNVSKKTFKEFRDSKDSKTVAESETFSENTTLIIKYSVTVTIKDVGNVTKDTITIDEGQNLTNGDQGKLNAIKEAGKFSRFVDANGKEYKEDTEVVEDTEIIVKYYKSVTIGDETPFDVEEGLTLENATPDGKKVIEKYTDTEEKRFTKFVDENGADVIVDKTPITDDTKLTAKYVVDIKILGEETYENTVEEGTLLSAVGYQKLDNFNRFVDEKGNTVDDSTPLNKHTTLKAIYNINVSINGHDYPLESFQTFGDVQDADEDIKALRENIPEGKISFSRFVYINKKGEEVELKDDTVLTSDITVIPKYNIELIIEYTNKDGEKEELYKVELEEGKTIRDLPQEKLDELNNKLREREKQLEQEGKHSFKFSKFLAEDGSVIAIDTTPFNNNSTIEAVFEYKPEPTPIEPNKDQVNNNDNNNSAKKYPSKVKVPNTGLKEITNKVFYILYLLAVICILSGFTVKTLRKIKVNNK